MLVTAIVKTVIKIHKLLPISFVIKVIPNHLNKVKAVIVLGRTKNFRELASSASEVAVLDFVPVFGRPEKTNVGFQCKFVDP